MRTKNIRSLLGKMNDHLTTALQEAAALALSATHFKLQPDHVFIKLLEQPDGDLNCILRHFNIVPEYASQKTRRGLDRFQTGNEDIPGYSLEILELLEAAWLVSSLQLQQTEIRSAALVEAYLDDSRYANSPFSQAVEKLDITVLRREAASILKDSIESGGTSQGELQSASENGMTAPATASSLDKYTVDFTARAKSDDADPITGRDEETRQAIDILSRRRKNNPMLVGEAGVGKTAVVEGLAQRIAANDVIESLRDTQIRGLDLGLLKAGAGMKGEFENRLKGVINEVVAAGGKVILFIDEAHTLIGAGGAAGVGDAANLLKPALARGQLRTIGATTWSEYKQHIESDPALERRFQTVRVDEPDEDKASTMLRGIKGAYAKHHGVMILDSAIEAAVRLSKRYIAGRQLPDKAVDVLDTAAARVRLASTEIPPTLEILTKRKGYLDKKLADLQADHDQGYLADGSEIDECQQQSSALEQQIGSLTANWDRQRDLSQSIATIRESLKQTQGSADKGESIGIEELKRQLSDAIAELRSIQETGVLVMNEVDAAVVASVISDWTGVPIGQILSNESESLEKFESTLSASIIGQDEALMSIGNALRVKRSGLGNPDSPIGVFLFVGPSGVGKTETARLTARVLLGDERFMTTINMSEYEKDHTVSQLKGAPPGYVGYGKGGVLTEAVRHRPYTVVLLDEVEKAHPNVMNLFYQVFDKGIMRDGEGREINFRNTIIMMTSNVGSEALLDLLEMESRPERDVVVDMLRPELLRHFPTALLARMNVIPFYPLTPESIGKIAELKMGVIRNRVRQAHRISLQYDSAIVNSIVSRCVDAQSGARTVDFIIDRTMLPTMSKRLLQRMVVDPPPRQVQVVVDEGGNFDFEIE